MTIHIASFGCALIGFFCLSLSLRRHQTLLTKLLTHHDDVRLWQPPLRLIGWGALAFSGVLMFGTEPQLGPIYWIAYAMAAACIVIAVHTIFEH